MKIISIFIITFSFLATDNSMNAQNGTNITDHQKKIIVNTWYESPLESKGDTILFRTTPFLLPPETDINKTNYMVISFGENSVAKVKHLKKCVDQAISDAHGKWYFDAKGNLILKFNALNCSHQMTFAEIKNDAIKVVFN